MKEEFTYQEAFGELQQLVQKIERGDISIDQLADSVKRATLLMEACKRKLTDTENDVKEILAQISTKELPED